MKKSNSDLGYMTIDAFVSSLAPGLKDYLKSNWGDKDGETYHQEDLFSNTSVYIEVARHLAGDFIIKPKE